MPVTDAVRALEQGTAFIDLSPWRAVSVTGADAVRWLDDLVTNRLDDLPDHVLRRTLFLDRTGRVQADVSVIRHLDGLVLVQDPTQPQRIEHLLDRYILSSDVALADRTGELGVVAMPDDGEPLGLLRLHGALGEAGDAARMQEMRRFASQVLLPATLDDWEIARIRRGLPRFGVDFGDEWLPSEAGVDDLIDTTKGCFLGQESVAKVRNLGHPPRLVRPFIAKERVYPMAQITTTGGETVGRVTSVAEKDDGTTACVGWVRWDARDTELTVEGGAPLAVRVGD